MSTLVLTKAVKEIAKQFESLTRPELLAIAEKATIHAKEKEETDKTEVKKQLAELAAKAGFDIPDLFGKARKNSGEVAPKYVNPADPSDKWTGRGRMPIWLKTAIENGSDKDEFLIDKASK